MCVSFAWMHSRGSVSFAFLHRSTVSIQHVNTCVLRRAAVRALYCVCTPHTRLPRHCHFSIACHLTFQSNSVFSNFVYFFRPDMTLGFKYGSTTAETDVILHNRRGDGTCYYRQNMLLLELIFQSNSEKYLWQKLYHWKEQKIYYNFAAQSFFMQCTNAEIQRVKNCTS